MKIRPYRVAIAIGIATAVIFLGAAASVSGLHWWRVWRANGVYCFPVNEADGNYFLYGDDCPGGDVAPSGRGDTI